jgi:hypothetical protein
VPEGEIVNPQPHRSEGKGDGLGFGRRVPRPITRRAFLGRGLGALAAAALPGCLSFSAPTESSPSPWPAVRFLHAGDLLMTAEPGGYRGLSLTKSIDRAFTAAEKMNALDDIDFILFSGNLIANRRPSDARVLLEFLGMLRHRWFVVPGSAEAAPGTDGLEKSEFLDLVTGHGPDEGRGFWAVRAQRRVWLLGIDTTLSPTADPGLWDRQLTLLKETVDGRPDELLLVLAHHPPLGPEAPRLRGPWAPEPPDPDREELRFVLEAGENIKMVFAGHRLWNEVRTVSGLHVVTSPSTGLFPAALREVRIRGRRARLLYHPLLSSEDESRAREAAAASGPARKYNPEMPRTFADLLYGTGRDREGVLRLR